MYPEVFEAGALERSQSTTVGIIIGVLSVLGVAAILFGAKVCFDKRKLGTSRELT